MILLITKFCLRSLPAAFLLCSLMCVTAWADEPEDDGMIFNFNNVDIRSVIKSVAQLTNRNFIIDPSVKGKVTIVSSRSLSQNEVYGVFLSILRVHNYTAVESGDLTKIVPLEKAPHDLGITDEPGAVLTRDTVITRIHQLEHVQADKLVSIIKPLMNPKSYLAIHSDSNSIIFIDSAANVERVVKMINKIDQQKSAELEIVKLEYADARDIIRVLEGLESKTKKGKAPAQQLKMISDERTNSILLSGADRLILKAKTMIAHLDTPIETEGSTQVIFLRHAIAKDLVPILTGIKAEKKELRKRNKQSSDNGRTDMLIQADAATNALIISAPPAVMKSLLAVIRKLDIRRGQVMIEAVVAEVSTGKSADLGVQWRSTSSSDDSGIVGGIDYSSTQRPTGGIGNVSANPFTSLSGGLNLGYFNGSTTILGTEILNLGSLISALNSDSDTNILSTPSLVTLDNQEAEINVGENVPFATGSYTSSTSGNPDNPFTTYERKNVGINLKIKPQINEGDTIRLEISQEVSKVIPSSAAAGLQSTDSRFIKTTVVVDDQKIIVLGGLISDDVQETVMKVPLLGDIPFLGNLFKYTYSKHEKKNLMVFLRPIIIRNADTSNRITFDKYDYMRRRQEEFNTEGINLMPNEKAPVLPEFHQDNTLTNQTPAPDSQELPSNAQ